MQRQSGPIGYGEHGRFTQSRWTCVLPTARYGAEQLQVDIKERGCQIDLCRRPAELHTIMALVASLFSKSSRLPRFEQGLHAAKAWVEVISAEDDLPR
eukprot:scaffold220784_cov32-Tisochrysis_lutea.AAC.10